MVRKFICSFIIVNLYSKNDRADLDVNINNILIENYDNFIKFKFLITKLAGNSDGYAQTDGLTGDIEYSDLKFKYNTDYIKLQDISSCYNLLQIIAYNNTLQNAKFSVLFEKIQVLYSVDNLYDPILTIYPKYLIKFGDFEITGDRSIKLKGSKFFMHSLNFYGPYNLEGKLDKFNADIGLKTFITEDINFNFWEYGKGIVNEISSDDFSSEIILKSIKMMQDVYKIDLEIIKFDVSEKILYLNYFNMRIGANIMIQCDSSYVDIVSSKLYFKNLKIFVEGELCSCLSIGCLDLNNQKIYLMNGEIDV